MLLASQACAQGPMVNTFYEIIEASGCLCCGHVQSMLDRILASWSVQSNFLQSLQDFTKNKTRHGNCTELYRTQCITLRALWFMSAAVTFTQVMQLNLVPIEQWGKLYLSIAAFHIF